MAHGVEQGGARRAEQRVPGYSGVSEEVAGEMSGDPEIQGLALHNCEAEAWRLGDFVKSGNLTEAFEFSYVPMPFCSQN